MTIRMRRARRARSIRTDLRQSRSVGAERPQHSFERVIALNREGHLQWHGEVSVYTFMCDLD